MSTHIGAKKGDIAKTILLPGDPLRAKFIAETFLENPVCYNEVRGMLGYTGTYKGVQVSVQGTGMGIPSISIYAHELIHEYGVKNLMRVGSCGSMQEGVKIRDVILASSASTTSSINKNRFRGLDFAPTASFELLHTAYIKAQELGIKVHVGNVLSSDIFYDTTGATKLFMEAGTLGVEMEAAALYTEAAFAGVNALTLLTVSDSLITGEETTAMERQETFKDMMKIALETAVAMAQE
ncbi:purine-nucleoside phosphorylase [Proteiniclasticum sp. BAD-10]|uniref:Purine nucleoside phosphorylase DeoD-type n=1 Tax=Proteiniclasticum sediminis TaxID=2804028 RepID=A0A941HPZ7_9CLOT|nr:purine-nucleoside phosphorylase [Proteiniclasticum sediminis]MBR0574918.1 purine-nucleoside phosphorylase [Proteiniclasticum sediminis]